MLKDWSEKSKTKAERVHYTAEFTVDAAFGSPGAITVMNKHQKEFFLESITIEGFAVGPVHFPCNSWVQSQKDHPEKRIFFTNQVINLKYLSDTVIYLNSSFTHGPKPLTHVIFDFPQNLIQYSCPVGPYNNYIPLVQVLTICNYVVTND